MFEVMLAEINTEAGKILFRLELASEEELRELEKRAVEAQKNKELKLKKDEAEALIGNNTGPDTSYNISNLWPAWGVGGGVFKWLEFNIGMSPGVYAVHGMIRIEK